MTQKQIEDNWESAAKQLWDDLYGFEVIVEMMEVVGE